MMNDIGTQAPIECTSCHSTKMRILVARKKKMRYYKDEGGRSWLHRTCPDCLKSNRDGGAPDPITARACRSCRTKLPASRYFECYVCKPDLPSIDESFIYQDDME